jgi:SAM-dependent methyltransferase
MGASLQRSRRCHERMKNIDRWRPTKFTRTRGGLKASRDTRQVARCSRLVADRIAIACYDALRIHARGVILDLGCGFVPLYEVYRERVSETVCVDWAKTLHTNSHVDHVADLNQPLPIESSSFDTILMTDVLEHIAEPGRLMAEVARLLRPRGKLILTVPFLYWLHEEPHDYYRYTRFALERFCTANGLTILELSAYGGLPEVMFDLAAKGAECVPKIGPLVVRLCNALSIVCQAGPVRKFSSWTSSSFPLGYLLVATKV